MKSVLWLLLAVTGTWCSAQVCQDVDVAFDGQTRATVKTKSAGDCSDHCSKTRTCSHWTFRSAGGECQVLATGDPGRKVGAKGAVSGVKVTGVCPGAPVSTVECHYTDTRDPVLCLFPFMGDSPGNRNTSGNVHDTCLETKRGHYWCATKLSTENLVVQASDQTRDISCGARLNPAGQGYCTAGQPLSTATGAGSQNGTATNSTLTLCPTLGTVQERVAQLERMNQALQDQLRAGGCTVGWSSWSSWSACSSPCQGNQTRSRTCADGLDCPGSPLDSRTCDSNCTTASRPASRGPTTPSSCRNRCSAPAPLGSCQCNSVCTKFGDCCSDYVTLCPGASPAPPTSAPANQDAARNPTSATRPVTPSRQYTRSNGATDTELAAFSETLLQLDENNVADKIRLELGCNTRVGNPRDCSSGPLFAQVDTSIFRKPVYEKLIALYENYDPNVAVKEDNTRSEQAEEVALIDEMMRTKVMQEVLTFLKAKNLFTKSETDFKRLLKEAWFGVYSRGDRILGSSGFEHVFLGEKKAGKVQGFHNWVYFYHLEKNKQVNYLGKWKSVDLNGRGTGMAFTFKWGTDQKPFASMLVGTSPELEMALYTTCLLARGEDKCPVRLGGQDAEISVHVFNRPGGVKYVASSFMDWK